MEAVNLAVDAEYAHEHGFEEDSTLIRSIAEHVSKRANPAGPSLGRSASAAKVLVPVSGELIALE
ncbi:hypothetical protein AB0J28_43730 [Streptosporangium canum]|uniref:hypothetical protein n=1 Tax=Streptosporangium canum TaxID=324952 RepID=UPI003427672D